MDESSLYFRAPFITCFPTINIETGIVTIEVRARDSDTGADFGGVVMSTTVTTINAESTTETTTVEKTYEAVEKWVLDQLSDLNPTATIEIA